MENLLFLGVPILKHIRVAKEWSLFLCFRSISFCSKVQEFFFKSTKILFLKLMYLLILESFHHKKHKEKKKSLKSNQHTEIYSIKWKKNSKK